MAKSEQLPVAEARTGESEAWEVLFRRYQLPLYVYVFELAQDEQASLDIVQETFIAAIRHIGSLQADENFGSWLFGIAHQQCVQRWRRQNREARWRDEIADATADLESSPDDLLIRREQEAQFMQLLGQLPLPQRTVLLLHFIEDFSLEEIARITGASLGTVKSRIYYGEKVPEKIVPREIAMKTPREILLERHLEVVPKLNAIRRNVLNSELRARTWPHPLFLRWLSVPWRELVWPYRCIWAGLAMVWLVIFAVNTSLRDYSPTVATMSSKPSPEMILALWRQEQLLIELIEPHRPRVAAPPKPALPRPRSQRRTEFLSA